MKIAVLGGSFDPPHLGHYLVTRQILEVRPDIDKILLMPAFQHQWKPIQASVKDRMQMLKSLVNHKPRTFSADNDNNLSDDLKKVRGKIEISEIETQRQGISYTIDTVREIKKTTNAFIYWIVGSDILTEFDRWEKTDQLVALTTFLVFPRDPYHIPENVPKGFEVLKDKSLVTTNISSTAIRQRIKEKKSISYLVPNEVEEFIKKNKLYI